MYLSAELWYLIENVANDLWKYECLSCTNEIEWYIPCILIS